MMKLYNSIDLFYKHATLISDMAHRIMFSLNKDFDIHAARWAASGAKDIIKYSLSACYEELGHFNMHNRRFEKDERFLLRSYNISKTVDPSPDTYENYKAALEFAVDTFNNKEGWVSDLFGGKAWGNIAKTTLKILNLYIGWKTCEKDTEKEENIIKKLIIQLNVFDGLAHNTGSIYNKLLNIEFFKKLYDPENLEDQKLTEDDIYRDIRDNYKELMDIRNISESDDPSMVYQSIEKHLHPTQPHQKTITKLKSDKDYYNKKDLNQFSKEFALFRALKQSGFSEQVLNDLKSFNFKKEFLTITREDMESVNFGDKFQDASIDFVVLKLKLSKLIEAFANLNNNIDYWFYKKLIVFTLPQFRTENLIECIKTSKEICNEITELQKPLNFDEYFYEAIYHIEYTSNEHKFYLYKSIIKDALNKAIFSITELQRLFPRIEELVERIKSL